MIKFHFANLFKKIFTDKTQTVFHRFKKIGTTQAEGTDDEKPADNIKETRDFSQQFTTPKQGEIERTLISRVINREIGIQCSILAGPKLKKFKKSSTKNSLLNSGLFC